jgi:nitroreductase
VEFTELIARRYSVRAYKPDPVEDEKLRKVLEAARLAPTAANRQPFQIIVAKTSGREQELSRVYKSEWFTDAPIVICVCGASSKAWTRWDGRNYCDVDVAIVMDHLILAAADQGLGTCWIGAFDPAAAREVFQVPDDMEPIVMTPLGYAADVAGGKKRKALDELVRYI